MSSTLHAVVRSPSLTGFGNRPLLHPAHQTLLLMGIISRICFKRRKPVDGMICVMVYLLFAFAFEAVISLFKASCGASPPAARKLEAPEARRQGQGRRSCPKGSALTLPPLPATLRARWTGRLVMHFWKASFRAMRPSPRANNPPGVRF